MIYSILLLKLLHFKSVGTVRKMQTFPLSIPIGRYLGWTLAKLFLLNGKNSFTICGISVNAEWVKITIIAINGPSSMHSPESNLKKLNGYYFSRRYSHNRITFS